MSNTVAMNSYLGGYFNNEHPNKLYKVKCMTMNTLLKKYPDYKEPDFVSIDIESGEEKLFSKCDFRVFKPSLIVVEYWIRGFDGKGDMKVRMDYKPKWEHYLLPYYEFKEETDGNAFYLRRK